MTKKNKLNGMRTYLVGPMDKANDWGAGWRSWLTPQLEEMGIRVFNPVSKPIDRGQEIERIPEREQLRKEGRYDELSKIMKEISNIDLRMVDICDFIIAHMDYSIPMNGTIHEIVLANMEKKPVLIHIEQGKQKMSDWWFGRLDHNEFFSEWDELLDYLKNINSGTFIPGKRWCFFDKDILV